VNKLTRIEELARKLNQEILALEVVQEYQKYEKLVLNDEKLKQLEKELDLAQSVNAGIVRRLERKQYIESFKNPYFLYITETKFIDIEFYEGYTLFVI